MTKNQASHAGEGDRNTLPLGSDARRNGTTLIRGRVNQKITQAAAAETLRVTPDDVKVVLFDDQGKVGLNIATLVRYDDVVRCAVRPDLSIYEMIKQARATIGEIVATVAGLEVGRINVSLTGIKKIEDEGGLL